MNLVTIASKSIKQRALASSLTAVSVALGVTLMVTVLVIHGVVDRMFSQSGTAYDLIVGPKGSKAQLVLNTVFRVSQPIENLPYRFYRQVAEDRRVKLAVPFALGDTTEEGGFPIVGTTPHYFTTPYLPRTKDAPPRKFRIRGELIRNPFDAIIGAQVARKNNWDIGSQFKLLHGGQDDHVHDELFTVVGVLEATGTPNDKTVFVHLDGFYSIAGHDKPLVEAVQREREFFGEPPLPPQEEEALRQKEEEREKEHAEEEEEDGDDHHHHHEHLDEAQKEVTAILVMMSGEDMSARVFNSVSFSSELKEGLQAQAINPAQEIRWLMQNIVGNVRTVLVVLTALIIVVSGVGIFVSIYNSMADRKREIAVMRALGARRRTVFSIILAESCLLCVAGGLLGLVLGHGLVFAAAPIVEARSGLLLNPFAFEPVEIVLIPSLIVLASLIGFIPGMAAYRTDVAKALAE